MNLYYHKIIEKFSFENSWEPLDLQVFHVNNLVTMTIKYQNTITERNEFTMKYKSQQT